MDAGTIDEVIRKLDEIVRWARMDGSRLGYFASLYRNVTRRVKARIAEECFEDGSRMERLDVAFANRYLDALEQYRAPHAPMQAWRLAFDASARWWPIVLQHLLLGMNAPINLDLGIAAARTCPGEAIRDLHEDFRRINDVLASMIDEIQDRLAEVWPLLGVPDRLAGRSEELDRAVAAPGEGILHPGLLAGAAVRAIRLGERRRVDEVVDILA